MLPETQQPRSAPGPLIFCFQANSHRYRCVPAAGITNPSWKCKISNPKPLGNFTQGRDKAPRRPSRSSSEQSCAGVIRAVMKPFNRQLLMCGNPLVSARWLLQLGKILGECKGNFPYLGIKLCDWATADRGKGACSDSDGAVWCRVEGRWTAKCGRRLELTREERRHRLKRLRLQGRGFPALCNKMLLTETAGAARAHGEPRRRCSADTGCGRSAPRKRNETTALFRQRLWVPVPAEESETSRGAAATSRKQKINGSKRRRSGPPPPLPARHRAPRGSLGLRGLHLRDRSGFNGQEGNAVTQRTLFYSPRNPFLYTISRPSFKYTSVTFTKGSTEIIYRRETRRGRSQHDARETQPNGFTLTGMDCSAGRRATAPPVHR
ncbi:uncharacterized protein LOC124417591 [Gallus gallus]|uniref:uncharacterized protein LOC124417591 n=1 Tax=Gallus gallus TaxID=9031 RepID=UPI001F01D499|nr:uncharacterized protein LOC124417591 [Gallus gallus]